MERNKGFFRGSIIFWYMYQSWTSMLVTWKMVKLCRWFSQDPRVGITKATTKNTGNRNDMRFTYTYQRHLLLPLRWKIPLDNPDSTMVNDQEIII